VWINKENSRSPVGCTITHFVTLNLWVIERKSDLLLSQLENPDLIECGSLTELPWAIVHLRDELMSRKGLCELPQTDLAHLDNDTKRAYSYVVGDGLTICNI
jgi:hypothetical protein